MTCEKALQVAMEIHFSTDWNELYSWRELMGVRLCPALVYLINNTCTTYRNAVAEFDRKDLPRPYYKKGSKRDESRIRAALRGR